MDLNCWRLSVKFSDQNGSLAIAKIAGSAGSPYCTRWCRTSITGDCSCPTSNSSKTFCFSSAILPSIPLICLLITSSKCIPNKWWTMLSTGTSGHFKMRRFWSIDDKTVHTEFSASAKAKLSAESVRAVPVHSVPASVHTGHSVANCPVAVHPEPEHGQPADPFAIRVDPVDSVATAFVRRHSLPVRPFASHLQMGAREASQLKVIDTRSSDSGIYVCVPTNEASTDQQAFTLEVLVPPKLVSDTPVQVAVSEGGTATLECKSRGYPAPQVIWSVESRNSPHFHPIGTILKRNVQYELSEDGQTLQLFCLSHESTRHFRSSMDQLEFGISIIRAPALSREGVLALNVTEGGPLLIPGGVKGTGKGLGDQIHWTHNAQLLTVNEQLSFAEVTPAQEGNYTCTVKNASSTCALVEQRRRLMADQIKLRRQQKKARIQTHHHQLNVGAGGVDHRMEGAEDGRATNGSSACGGGDGKSPSPQQQQLRIPMTMLLKKAFKKKPSPHQPSSISPLTKTANAGRHIFGQYQRHAVTLTEGHERGKVPSFVR